jgi:hypothetical protein
LTLDPDTGILSGDDSVPVGSYPIAETVPDADGTSASANITLTVK